MAPASRRPTILAAGFIVLAGVAAYHNSFGGAFVYDDEPAIIENPTIRHLWPVGHVLSPPSGGETVSGRPLLNLSLAINYALGGLDVWGYHAVNLAIHIAAALLLCGILRRTFLMPALGVRFGSAALPLALAATLLWTIHPLQTESVTYIIQRAESLAGLFYFLTLYCVIRGTGTVPSFLGGTDSSAIGVPQAQEVSRRPLAAGAAQIAELSGPPVGLRPLVWYCIAILACLLGMATKEVMVTAPLIVLLYDRTFLAGSFSGALRQRWGLYAGLVATWGLLAHLVLSTGLIFRQSELLAPDALSYARTQPGVILYYLRLSVWPSPLCCEYPWSLANTLGEILPGAIVVGLLLAATLWGMMRRKAWGFLGAWFLLILAPTSSILPLTAPEHEHRMYLPLAAVAVLAVAGGYAFWDRLLLARGLSPFPPRATPHYQEISSAEKGTVPLGSPGAQTSDPLDELRARRPRSKWPGTVPFRSAIRWAAPMLVLATLLTALGYVTVARNRDYRTAIVLYQDTIDKCQHNPDAQAMVCNILGNDLAADGKTFEAVEQYRQALRLRPDYVKAHNNLGLALANVGRVGEAIEHYRQALHLKPDDAAACNNLGLALDRLGRIDDALAHYQRALHLKPDYADAHNNLANALDSLGKTDEAIEHYQRALRLKPDYAEAHSNLGTVLASLGRIPEAIEHYRRALLFKPDYAEAHNNLAHALAGIGQIDEAIEHYSEALRLKADFVVALNNLAWLLATRDSAQGGDPARAVQLAQRARGLGGRENARCLDTLAAAYAAAGRFDAAVLTAEQAVQLAASTGRESLAKLIRSRLKLYRAGQPYREPPIHRVPPQ